jgi:hypothetical protein
MKNIFLFASSEKPNVCKTDVVSFRFKAIQILKLALVFCTVEGNTVIHFLSHSNVHLSILDGLVIWFLSGITQGRGGGRVEVVGGRVDG